MSCVVSKHGRFEEGKSNKSVISEIQLSDIAEELILIIFSHLSDKTLLQTLYQTCKTFRNLIIKYRNDLIKLKELLNDTREQHKTDIIVKYVNGYQRQYVEYYGFVEQQCVKNSIEISKRNYLFTKGMLYVSNYQGVADALGQDWNKIRNNKTREYIAYLKITPYWKQCL